MSYGRGMGLILRPPTRTYGFRGMRYTYEPPTPRMPRVGLRWYQRMNGLGDATTGATVVPYTYGTQIPWTPSPVVDTTGTYNFGTLTPPPSDAAYSTQANLPLAPVASVGPSVMNYSPAALVPNPQQYANAAVALAAGLNPQVVAAAFPPQPAMPSWLTPTNMLLGGGLIFGLSMLMGGKKGRR